MMIKMKYILILWMIILIGCIIGVNIHLVDEYKRCTNSEPNRLVNATVVSCDGIFITAQITEQAETTQCTVHLKQPTNCDFPTNSLYIYVSKNKERCSIESFDDDCPKNLVLVNVILGMFFITSIFMFFIDKDINYT